MPRPHPTQPDPDRDRCWPSCDQEQPGVLIRPLHHADLPALLAHLDHSDPDLGSLARPAGRWPAAGGPVVAVRVPHGTPDRCS